MHELGLAQELVELASERCGTDIVRRVHLSLGTMAAVSPDALRFAFMVCREGTPLAQAELDIVEVPATGRCRACSTECSFQRPPVRCACGQDDLEWLSGDEILITGLEVEPCA